ncbi:MAG: hypothetical protein Q9195_005376 [Heterodermia aff. obscurata]
MHFPKLRLPKTVTIGKDSVRIHSAVNFLILTSCCSLLLANSIIAIATQINQALHRPRIQPQNGCNGHPELCTRSYSNITQIGAHESAFVGIMPFDNQNFNVTTQLNAGIRFVQVQTRRNHFGQLALCHTHCLMENAGLLSDYLLTVREWLDTHPQEVVTLLLTTHDHFNMTAFDAAFTVSGAKHYAFTPPVVNHTSSFIPIEAWPTLGALIAQNTRLVTFMDYGAPDPAAPYILPEFRYFWETPFDSTNPAILQECNMDRPGNLVRTEKNTQTAKTTGFNYIVNHFLDTEVGVVSIPDRRDTKRTNSWVGKGGIGEHVSACEAKWGRKPGVVLVDFFEEGEVIKAQNLLNGFG